MLPWRAPVSPGEEGLCPGARGRNSHRMERFLPEPSGRGDSTVSKSTVAFFFSLFYFSLKAATTPLIKRDGIGGWEGR